MFSEVEKVINCHCTIIHQDIFNKVNEDMLDDEVLSNLADLYKVFGDKTRVKILHVLSKAEMCVCDISALLNMNSSSVSHQLKSLRQAKLVKYGKEGKVVYYSLTDDHVKHVFNEGLILLREK